MIQILLALIILLTLSDNVVVFSEALCVCLQSRLACLQAHSFMELFAGQGWVSRIMRTAGHQTCNLDLNMGLAREGKQNFYDLLSDAGFLLLGRALVLGVVASRLEAKAKFYEVAGKGYLLNRKRAFQATS